MSCFIQDSGSGSNMTLLAQYSGNNNKSFTIQTNDAKFEYLDPLFAPYTYIYVIGTMDYDPESVSVFRRYIVSGIFLPEQYHDVISRHTSSKPSWLNVTLTGTMQGASSSSVAFGKTSITGNIMYKADREDPWTLKFYGM